MNFYIKKLSRSVVWSFSPDALRRASEGSGSRPPTKWSERRDRFLSSLRRRKAVFVVLAAVVAVGVFGIGHPAHAQVGATLIEFVLSAAGKLLELYLSLVSQLVMFAVNLLIEVAGYNNFINATAVKEGWVIMRDIANMVIVVVLLVIAFGTMLGKEEYHWKQLLPRLIITAIFINFSKTVIGIMIDAGQVVMLTFVNGFAAAAGGNFMNALRLTDTINLVKGSGGISLAGIEVSNFMAYLLGAITVTIALIVITVFLIILLFRVIALWVLIIFAPLAWVLGTFPKGQEYYAEWWKRLTNQIIVGPILAFFLWLSLVVAGSGQIYNEFSNPETNPLAGKSAAAQEFGKVHGCSSKICEWENLAGYFIAIALLMAGLQFTQELGVAGAGVAGGAASMIKSYGTRAAKFAALAPLKTARAGLSWAEQTQARYTRLRFNPVKIWEGIKEGFKVRGEHRESEAQKAVTGRYEKGGLNALVAGMFGANKDFVTDKLNGFMGWKAIPQLFKGRPARTDKFAAEEAKAGEEKEKAEQEAAEADAMAGRMTPDEKKQALELAQQNLTEANGKAELAQTGGNIDMGIDANQQVAQKYVDAQRKKEATLRAESEDLRKAGKIKEANTRKKDANGIAAEVAPIEQAIRDKTTIQMTGGSGWSRHWGQSWNVMAAGFGQKHRYLNMSRDDRTTEIAKLRKGKSAATANAAATEVDVTQEKPRLEQYLRGLSQKYARLYRGGELSAADKVKTEMEKIDAAIKAGGTLQLTPEMTFTDAWKKEWEDKAIDVSAKLSEVESTQTITDVERTQHQTKRTEALGRAAEAGKRQRAARLEKEEAEALTPIAYYARQEARAHQAEEQKKIETDNATELQAYLRAAFHQENPDKVVAVMRQAAKFGHTNEMMYALRDHNGEKFRGDHIGLSQFVNEILVDKLKVPRGIAYGYQQDIGQISKGAGHWNFAEGIAYDKGRFRQRGFDFEGRRKGKEDEGTLGTSLEHQQILYIEKEKAGGIDRMLTNGRMAWGPEFEDEAGRRTWGFDDSGLGLMRKGYGAIEFKSGRGQMQDNLVRYIIDNKENGIGALARMIAALPEAERGAKLKSGATIEDVLLKILPSSAPKQTDAGEYMRVIAEMMKRQRGGTPP